jgi:uncharacterized protein YqgC (DUF456 family)
MKLFTVARPTRRDFSERGAIQGPLLGIFVAGPIGFIAGMTVGLVAELVQR